MSVTRKIWELRQQAGLHEAVNFVGAPMAPMNVIVDIYRRVINIYMEKRLYCEAQCREFPE